MRIYHQYVHDIYSILGLMTKIICIGKKHEQMYVDALGHFESRIKPFSKLEWLILPHSSLQGREARSEESARILAKFTPSDHVILLDESGKNLTSPEIAVQLEKAQNTAKSIVFVIGGSYGVDDSIKARADACVAFGRAVFPHQLMRVLLLEQIYRGHSINAGSKYHHI
jgi:23S rRNA (pseudouridine1915-N3)-methyltransferase